jgi:hypothetical protein
MDEEVFAFGSFRLITAQRALFEGGKPLRLGSRAFDILLALIERAGETISKDVIMRDVTRQGAGGVRLKQIKSCRPSSRSTSRLVSRRSDDRSEPNPSGSDALRRRNVAT